jgi:oxalate decarboxylase/phosphoglucose isomerase-like protein (cupin superfamily)
MEEVEFLEIFRAPNFADFNLEQWLANVPRRVVVEHLFKDHPSTGKKFMEGLRAAKEPTKENPKF